MWKSISITPTGRKDGNWVEYKVTYERYAPIMGRSIVVKLEWEYVA